MVCTVSSIVKSSLVRSSGTQPKVQLRRPRDHVLDDAVDGVLIGARPLGHEAPDVAPDGLDEARRFPVAVLLRIG